MEALRTCRECGVHAYTRDDLEDFEKGPDTKYPYGRQTICKKCERIKKSERMVKHRYGITKEEYQECMDTSICCEICNKTNNLVYDHNHSTMKFRGVLCRECNSALGHLGDTPEGVLKAYEYLQRKH